jgi:ABC-type branched-subunit amino acid transport system substrate-binding protein
VIPIAAQANLPEVGADMSDPSTFNAPGIFPTDMGGLIDSSGAVVLAKDYHARSICLAVIDSPGAAGASAGLINSLYLGPLGMKLAKVVPIPTTATDYSPEVAALKGCDGVQLAIGTDQVTHLLQTAQQLGLDVPMTVATSLYSAQALANFGQLGSKVALLSPFSFASPGYQAFLADMTKYNPGGRTSALAVKSWLTAKLIADAAKSIHGEITRASLSTTLHSLSGYDTQGLTYMPIDYTAKSTIAGGTLSRVFPFMTWVFPYKEANGQPVPMGPAINPFQTR